MHSPRFRPGDQSRDDRGKLRLLGGDPRPCPEKWCHPRRHLPLARTGSLLFSEFPQQVGLLLGTWQNGCGTHWQNGHGTHFSARGLGPMMGALALLLMVTVASQPALHIY